MTSPKAAAFNSTLQRMPEAHHRGVNGPRSFARQRWLRLPRWFRVWAGRLASVLFALASPLLAYLMTALFLGSILTGPDEVVAEPGVEVYVVTFGAHTDLMAPARHGAMDWTPWFPDRHFEKPRFGEYAVLGWGNRRFYEEVREWKDLRPGVALRSLFPSPTLMHVSRFPRPLETNQVQRVVLTGQGYARMCERLRSGFRLDEEGRPRLVPGLNYFGGDAFYLGAGRYDAITTCNEWAAAALRSGGVRMGLWTPFARQVRESLAIRGDDKPPGDHLRTPRAAR